MSPGKGGVSAPPAGRAEGAPHRENGGIVFLRRAENAVSVAILCAMALLPLL